MSPLEFLISSMYFQFFIYLAQSFIILWVIQYDFLSYFWHFEFEDGIKSIVLAVEVMERSISMDLRINYFRSACFQVLWSLLQIVVFTLFDVLQSRVGKARLFLNFIDFEWYSFKKLMSWIIHRWWLPWVHERNLFGLICIYYNFLCACYSEEMSFRAWTRCFDWSKRSCIFTCKFRWHYFWILVLIIHWIVKLECSSGELSIHLAIIFLLLYN